MATVNWDSGYTKTLTIASGQTISSDVLNLAGLGARRVFSVSFRSPATLPETVTLQTSETPTGTFAPYQSGGADIVLAVGESTPVTDIIAGALRLSAGVAVAANRVFVLVGNARM